jgi:hypothetical protein
MQFYDEILMIRDENRPSWTARCFVVWRVVAVAASSPPQPSSVLVAREAERTPRRGDAAMEGGGAGVGRPRREDDITRIR